MFKSITIAALLAALATPISVAALKPGEVKLCTSFSLKGDCQTLRDTDFNFEQIGHVRHNDRITSIEWNLRSGTGITLTQGFANNDFKSLPKEGLNLDLVEQGRITDLRPFDLNDKLTSFSFFEYDEKLGYVELCRKRNDGDCKKIFLSHHEPGKAISMSGWSMEDEASTISWSSLIDTAFMTFFFH